MTHPNREELAERLDPIIADHLRLASWNKGKDRPARVAFHHDAVLTLKQAAAALRQSPSVEEVARMIDDAPDEWSADELAQAIVDRFQGRGS